MFPSNKWSRIASPAGRSSRRSSHHPPPPPSPPCPPKSKKTPPHPQHPHSASWSSAAAPRAWSWPWRHSIACSRCCHQASRRCCAYFLVPGLVSNMPRSRSLPFLHQGAHLIGATIPSSKSNNRRPPSDPSHQRAGHFAGAHPWRPPVATPCVGGKGGDSGRGGRGGESTYMCT